MGFKARLGILAAVAAVTGMVLASTGTIEAALMGEAAIKARKDAMKSNSNDMKAIQAFVKDGKGSAADVAKAATSIAETTKKLGEMFPKGTGRGDVSDKETRALPAIWKDMDGFKKVAARTVTEAEKLTTTAKGGDKDAIGKQVAVLNKEGCGACHTAYRGEAVK
jgi:cytochrome c556